MKKNQKGSALLLATILLFVVLSMVVSLSYVTVMEQKMSQKTKSSVGSFYNAESGVEWALNKIANLPETTSILSSFNSPGFNPDGSARCPAGFSAECKVFFLGEDGKVLASSATIDKIKAVRSVGSEAQGTQRAIEAAVAGSGDNQLACTSFTVNVAVVTTCCKINTNTGSTSCKQNVNTNPTVWTDEGSPF